jgi:hypothetical protein
MVKNFLISRAGHPEFSLQASPVTAALYLLAGFVASRVFAGSNRRIRFLNCFLGGGHLSFHATILRMK